MCVAFHTFPGQRVGGELTYAEQAFLTDRLPVPEIERGELKRVLDVKQIVVAVNWLCMSQFLSPEAQNGQERPKRYWTEIDQLALVRASACVLTWTSWKKCERAKLICCLTAQGPPPLCRRPRRIPRSSVLSPPWRPSTSH